MLSYYSSPKYKSLFHKYLTSLTSVHYNLEHGLAIITEGFSPLDLDHTKSFVKVQTRSGVTSHAIPDTVFLPYTLEWYKLVCTGYNLNLMYSSLKCRVKLSTLVFITHRRRPWFYHTMKHMHINNVYSHGIFRLQQLQGKGQHLSQKSLSLI